MLVRSLTILASLAGVVAAWAVTPATAGAQPVETTRGLPATLPSDTSSRSVDVDGDGRLDRLVMALDDGVATVSVTTARGASDSRSFDVSTSNPLYGTAKLDGRKGAEVLVNIDDYDLRVLAWRNGKFVDEPLSQPSAAAGKAVVQTEWMVDGDTTSWWRTYHVSTSHGVRYIDAASLYCGNCERTGIYASATVVRSRWRSTGWQRVRVTVHRRITRKQAEAHYLKAFSGVGVKQ